ncbi:SRPBCC family protein [Streptomyces sp. NPDC050560]|uniref:SRPBCC family protein n=1 Tax=Streptomyces sp. NPDC050560 TaxID=3365630 RepID=UPI0037B2B67A
MEYEVFVPATQAAVRQALADPALVARAVPGLQRDAGEAGPGLAGRLKVRVGGGSITYRGTLSVVPGDGGAYTVAAEGVEARGEGRVTAALTLRLAPAEGGTLLTFTGTATGDGRLADLDPSVAATAGRRVLRKFGEELAAVAPADPAAPGEPRTPEAPEAPGAGDLADPGDSVPEDGAFDDDAPFGGEDEPMTPAAVSEDGSALGYGGEPPAEAAHARRTMIGRSAEEVDHAPPRGRYAPQPAAGGLTASAALRWAAPAAVVAFASAVVISRALRRRR